jgi:hypothetical protein
MSGVLSFVLRTLLGSEGVLQCLHFWSASSSRVSISATRVGSAMRVLLGKGVFHHGKVYRMGVLIWSPGGCACF